ALEQYRRHHAADHIGAAADDPVVEHERGVAVADGGGDVAAELARRDQVARLREAGDVRRYEERRLVRDRPQRLVRRGERDGPRGVRVDDAVDVGAGAYQLGVNRIFDVPAAGAFEHLAVPRDEEHLFRPDLLEAVRGR